jgi:hypothetical protein
LQPFSVRYLRISATVLRQRRTIIPAASLERKRRTA